MESDHLKPDHHVTLNTWTPLSPTLQIHITLKGNLGLICTLKSTEGDSGKMFLYSTTNFDDWPDTPPGEFVMNHDLFTKILKVAGPDYQIV